MIYKTTITHLDSSLCGLSVILESEKGIRAPPDVRKRCSWKKKVRLFLVIPSLFRTFAPII